MKKSFLFIALALIFCQAGFSQDLSKDEKKRLKEELKNYGKDLAGYKAKMEDIRATLDSNEAEIKRLKDDQAFAGSKQAELENKITDLDGELKKAKQESALLRGENVPDADPEMAAKAQSDLTNKAQKGTVYKVQIGLYKNFSINKYFDAPRFIGYEEVDGLNRYIISYFPDEAIAKSFVADVRKMGIKDAFVSKYIDGVRVYEWNKNSKYDGKPEPESLQDALNTK